MQRFQIGGSLGCAALLSLLACTPTRDDADVDAATDAMASASALVDLSRFADSSWKDAGMVSIPAGTLRAGYECGSAPRATPYEQRARPVELATYSIDKFPFPNDPSHPAVGNVTRDEAAELCRRRGKRLCTELEWERACKGPRNFLHERGNAFDHRVCAPQADRRTMRRKECHSGFGVYDMHGVVSEWTSSQWGRGTSAGQAAVRGSSFEDVSARNGRCVYGEARTPTERDPATGFRCCAGEPNAAKVELDLQSEPAFVADDTVDDELAERLIAAMPPEYGEQANLQQAIEKIWRWRPVLGEELLVARWRGALPERNEAFYQLVVYTECPTRVMRAARARGPVESLAEPKLGSSPDVLAVMMQSPPHSGTMTLRYWHGRVQSMQPDWVGHALMPTLRLVQ